MTFCLDAIVRKTSVHLLFLLTATICPTPAQSQEVIPCLRNADCPEGTPCFWGICDSGLVQPTGTLFQWSVLDLPDLTQGAGTLRLRDRLGSAFSSALVNTGLFRAIRHGGSYPVDTGSLLDAMEQGSAYVLSAALTTYDGTNIGLELLVLDTETGLPVPELCDRLLLKSSGTSQALQEWVNRAVYYFSGRPGILGARLACVRKIEKGIKEVFLFTYGLDVQMTRLTTDRTLSLLPSWTHDGRVAFTSYRKGRPMIFISGEDEPFTSFEGMNSGIEWSYDGSVAAISLSKDGDSEIYLLEGTTGEERARLTFHPGIDTSPSWSPDASVIAFVSDREGTPQLYSMNADGTNKERLTTAGNYNTSPDWHPFGPYLVYSARFHGEFQVFRLDLESRERVQLTFAKNGCEGPDWSPDGRLVACICREKDTQNIYVLSSDGSNRRAVTIDDGPYYAPVWEPLYRP
jgi:tol-pal system beta propeller repeat protein TolB